MQIPNFSQDQFVNSTALNTAVGYIKNSFETENTSFYTPGLIYSQDLIYTFNNSLTVSLNASSPFSILDANGILSQALGTVNGTTSPIYSLNFAPFVPSSGSVTVYITATTTPIYLQSYQVIGPPVGHPDYNPSFAPYTAYGEAVDSLSITLSTTAPNNQTVFELGRVVLTSGQTAVTSVTTSYQVNCKLYISAIDVQPVKNAIQIGQITSTNQALISGVVPSGVSNNLIQFLVNGSNVFIVDVNGNITSAGNLTVSGSITSGAITTSGLITANGGIATSSIAGNPSFTGGLTVPSGETLTVGGNTVVDTLTVSGLITANAGIDVAGGTLTVPNATATNEPPTMAQASGVVGATRNLRGYLSVAGTSVTFTADEIIEEEALGGVRFCRPSFNQTLDIATTGAGGMDTGAAPVSGYVAIYAIYDPSTGADSILATNATSAVAPEVYGGGHMPAGYTASALISVWPTNASGQLIVGLQVGRRISRQIATALSSNLVVGWSGISVSGIVPPNAKSVAGVFAVGNATSSTMSIAVGSDPNGLGYFDFSFNNDASTQGVPYPDIYLQQTQTLYYQTSSTAGTPGFTIYVSQYTF